MMKDLTELVFIPDRSIRVCKPMPAKLLLTL